MFHVIWIWLSAACFGSGLGAMITRLAFLREFNEVKFASRQRNQVLEDAARYVEGLSDLSDAKQFAAAIREMKGIE